MSIINWNILYIGDPLKGRPLFGGKIFVGIPDLDPEVVINQKQLNVVQEDGTVVAVGQPFILSAGGVPMYNGSPVRLDVDGNFSIKILDRNDSQTYYIENIFEGQPVTVDEMNTAIEQSFIDKKPVFNFPDLNSAVISTDTTRLLDGAALNLAERTVGNGSGAIWDVITAGTTVYVNKPNTFNIVQCTGVPTLALKLRTSGRLNVKEFGAIGDGVVDDADAINGTIASLNIGGIDPAANGVDIYFPPGKYYINSSINTIAGRRIVLVGTQLGVGTLGTTILTDNPNIDMVNASDSAPSTFSMNGLNLEGAGVGTGTGNGVKLGKIGIPLFDSRINNCWFGKIPSAGIYSINTQGYHFNNNAFEGALYGIYFADDDTASTSANSDNILYGNRFFRLSIAGVFITKGTNNQIDGNHFDRVAFFEDGTNDDSVGAIKLQYNNSTDSPRGTSIMNNVFGGATGPNVNDINISGNISVNGKGPRLISVLNNTTSKAIRQFLYMNSVSEVVVKGNVMFDTCSGNVNEATTPISGTWEFEGSSINIQGDSTDCVISDNTNQFSTTEEIKQATHGLNLGSSTTNMETLGNTFVGKDGPTGDLGTNNAIENALLSEVVTIDAIGAGYVEFGGVTIKTRAARSYTGYTLFFYGNAVGAGSKNLKITVNGTQQVISFNDGISWALKAKIIYSSSTSLLMTTTVTADNEVVNRYTTIPITNAAFPILVEGETGGTTMKCKYTEIKVIR